MNDYSTGRHHHRRHHHRHETPRSVSVSLLHSVMISILIVSLLQRHTSQMINAFQFTTTFTPSSSTTSTSLCLMRNIIDNNNSKNKKRRNCHTSLRRMTTHNALSSSLDNTMENSRLENDKETDENNNNDDDTTVVVTWLDESTIKEDSTTKSSSMSKTSSSSTTTTTTNKTVWGSKLAPRIKERIILAGQQRAIANKQKRISDMDRKRRQLMFVKERQREKKLSHKIDRPIPLASASTDIQRIPLQVYQPGMKCYGTCISLTNFGAYIDIGTECDGLLHVTQMYINPNKPGTTSTSTTTTTTTTTKSTFINHPKQIVQPGDEILVTIRSINPIRKKLHLTLLPWDIVQEQLAIELETKALKRGVLSGNNDNNNNNSADDDDDDDDDNIKALSISSTDRIPLSDIQIDDELWGEIKRVTDFGAYIEVGAMVDGFLHYMDHPSFTYAYNNNINSLKQQQQPIHPSSIMRTGDRVRVWVSDLDTIRNRIKLTAHRPSHLPGPRREL